MTRCFWERPIRPRLIGFRKTITFELTLVSAVRLPEVKRWSGRPMNVYAEVSLDGGAVKKSDVDMNGGANPTWNFTVNYHISESTLQKGVNLIIGLFCKRSVGRSLLGKVKICVKSLYEMGLRGENDLGYPVKGTLDGSLNISYAFRVPTRP